MSRNIKRNGPARQKRHHTSLRWQALSESAALVAIAAAFVLVLLLLAGAPRPYQLIAWVAFVADLVILRLAGLRVRQIVEATPSSLGSWRREDPPVTIYDV